MTGRRWKSGDAAMVNGQVCINTGGDWEHGSPLAFKYADHESLDVRPVVVIDPEDREQARSLLETYGRQFTNWTPELDSNVTRLQAALREFANPKQPKPEEPTGLGAVVRDAAGDLWVSLEPDGSGPRRWVPADNSERVRRNYVDLPIVAVLSEGVPL